ncbi:hypothetical protein BT69DRAFT_598795 [Atractiella rhizophila]|nr:hypothetical protein BT69DRAFT_918382 [Atractiella rhizophila]KAH8918187.1 hypothetical protein BT69DRAFT_598795 [Atractiella rhizophila]
MIRTFKMEIGEEGREPCISAINKPGSCLNCRFNVLRVGTSYRKEDSSFRPQ